MLIIHYEPIKTHLVPLEEDKLNTHLWKHQSHTRVMLVFDKQSVVDKKIAESEEPP